MVALRGGFRVLGSWSRESAIIAKFGEEALLLPGTAMLTVASQTPVAAWSAPGLPKVVWPWLDSRHQCSSAARLLPDPKQWVDAMPESHK